MSGCIRGALDLDNSEKDKNLEYLANLLEDASDFCFENAKACSCAHNNGAGKGQLERY